MGGGDTHTIAFLAIPSGALDGLKKARPGREFSVSYRHSRHAAKRENPKTPSTCARLLNPTQPLAHRPHRVATWGSPRSRPRATSRLLRPMTVPTRCSGGCPRPRARPHALGARGRTVPRVEADGCAGAAAAGYVESAPRARAPRLVDTALGRRSWCAAAAAATRLRASGGAREGVTGVNEAAPKNHGTKPRRGASSMKAHNARRVRQRRLQHGLTCWDGPCGAGWRGTVDRRAGATKWRATGPGLRMMKAK